MTDLDQDTVIGITAVVMVEIEIREIIEDSEMIIEAVDMVETIEAVDMVETIEAVDMVETIEAVDMVETIEAVDMVETIEAVDMVETIEAVDMVENDSEGAYSLIKMIHPPKHGPVLHIH